MLKKYAGYLIMGPLSNALWAWWVLPQINEQGTLEETIQWILVQAMLPALFAVLLLFRQKFVYWLMAVYSGFIILYGAGILGWAFMGSGVPKSLYTMCLMLMIMGYGILFHSLKDLNVGRSVKNYHFED